MFLNIPVTGTHWSIVMDRTSYFALMVSVLFDCWLTLSIRIAYLLCSTNWFKECRTEFSPSYQLKNGPTEAVNPESSNGDIIIGLFTFQILLSCCGLCVARSTVNYWPENRSPTTGFPERNHPNC